MSQNRFLVVTSLVVLLSIADAHAQTAKKSGGDRCGAAQPNCLCEVRPNSTPNTASKYEHDQEPQAREVGGKLQIYFAEDERTVDADDIAQIERFLARTRCANGYTLKGYADTCGGDGYNLNLSADRIKAVDTVIRGKSPSTKASKTAYGENFSSQHHQYFRRVEISPDRSCIERNVTQRVRSREEFVRMLEVFPADYYLFDASGSMSPYWGEIANFKFPKKSRIFLSKMSGCPPTKPEIDTQSPSGGTEIWYSWWKAIDSMQPNTRLLVASDFETMVPLSANEQAQIEAKMREKNITVVTIQY